ncbi:MAG: TrkH family potassium uptake protein, partial [Flavobacteriaceae bacterium]
MSRLNHKLISYILGLLLLFNGLAMLVTSGVSLLVNDGVFNDITSSGIITISFGIILMLLNRNNIRQINKRDGYLIVTLGWITMILSGMLPYYLTGSLSTFSNMLFESMSGYT